MSENGLVYDLGASIGNIGNSLKQILKKRHCDFIGIEKSKEMFDLYNCKYGSIVNEDIKDYNYKNYDIAISFLFSRLSE